MPIGWASVAELSLRKQIIETDKSHAYPEGGEHNNIETLFEGAGIRNHYVEVEVVLFLALDLGIRWCVFM